MNKQFIEKILKSNKEECSELVFENPLLDMDVSKSLSRSFMKILNISSQNSNINNNLRLAVLENIRNLCQTHPEGHVILNDEVSESVNELYLRHYENVSNISSDPINRKLDDFIVRKMKDLQIKSNYESAVNPETMQALINLNRNGVHLDMLLKDTICWNTNNKTSFHIVKNLWNTLDINSTVPTLLDDLSIKMKQEIEKEVLEICYDIIVNKYEDLNTVYSTNNNYKNLVKKCSVSPQCYQMCYSIFNFVFIMNNFDLELQKFIPMFVRQVKENCSHISFAVMYHLHLSNVVLLLDFEINILKGQLRDMYVRPALKYLRELESENDVILLLSHFPQWFDIYFDQGNASHSQTAI